MLRAVVESERVPPRVGNKAARQTAIDPKLETSGGTNLDLVVGVCGCPRTDVLPVPVFTHGLGRYGIFEEVNLVLVGARIATESVRGWIKRSVVKYTA
jgi:hypothetical protein